MILMRSSMWEYETDWIVPSDSDDLNDAADDYVDLDDKGDDE